MSLEPALSDMGE